MRKTRMFLAAATVAVAVTGGLFATSRNDHADAAVGPVTWEDNFDGPAGQSIDGNKWKFDLGGGGWGNGELQTYTNTSNNVAKDGQGHLVITARRESNGGYTSGRILTADKFTQRYGRFEARLQIPRGQGIWPAFWMLGDNIGSVGWPNSGEIDIMENIGREPNTVHGTVHGPGYSGGAAIGGGRTIGSPLADGFHTYAVDWSPNLIIWYLDGAEYFRVTPASLNGNRWVFDHPFFMILNVAVGGAWPGNPDASTQFPQRMVIDYVRVNAADGGTTPPPAGGNGIRSNFSNRCIDIPAANPVDGARLQLYDCNGTAAQQWTANGDGTLRAMGKCMDPAGGALTNATPIQLVTCNGNPVQRFTLQSNGDLKNVSSGRCVDVKDWNANNGAQLQLWDCAGSSNQRWTRV